MKIIININWNIEDFITHFSKLYHISSSKYKLDEKLSVFIKNKKISRGDSLKNNNIFLPHEFDYEKDYIIVLEKEDFDIFNIDLGSKNKKFNFKNEKVPHIVFSSHNNICLQSIIVSKQLKFLECEIYVFKDEYYFNLERNIGKYNLKKAKDVLSSIDWKDKCKYVTSIKSINSSSYENNEDAISFTISPQLLLYHDKSYVFLITSPNLNINVFSSGCGDNGVFIVSSNINKAILNGFTCKNISDLALDNSFYVK